MKVLAFDLDRTLLKQNSSLAFCRYLLAHRALSFSQFIFSLRCYFSYRFLGGSYHQLHQKVFTRLLLKKSHSTFESHARQFVRAKVGSLFYMPVVERLKKGKACGEKVLILSSSPTFLVEPIAHLLGADGWLATSYRVDAEGNIEQIADFVDGETKARFLRHFTEKVHAPAEAYSDSFDDLPFLLEAAKAVAVKPDARLYRYAKMKQWEIL